MKLSGAKPAFIYNPVKSTKRGQKWPQNDHFWPFLAIFRPKFKFFDHNH